MEVRKFAKIYLGFLMVFLSYQVVFYLVVSTLETAEQIIKEENDKKITNQNLRGGQGDIVVRKQRSLIARLIAKSIRNTTIYKRAKMIGTVLASAVGVCFMRIYERYDCWAVVISESLVSIHEKYRRFIYSLRRMRLGLPIAYICVPLAMESIEGNFDEAIKSWLDLLTIYEDLGENNQQKNAYFACIISLLTMLRVVNPARFSYLIGLLYLLYKSGRISYLTYLEIVYYLIANQKSNSI